MKNKTLLFLLGLILCSLLTSCGIPKPPQEDDIMQDIPDEITTIQIGNPFDSLNMYVYDLDIMSVTVQKRQTNGKEDVAYCVVELGNEYYQFTKYLCLNYNYYDEGGWILDDYSEYSATDWKVIECPLNVEDVAYVCDYPQVELGESTFDGENGTASFHFDVEDARNNGAFRGTVTVDCQFDGEKWIYTKNSDDVKFIWDIIGTWSYSKVEKTSYDSTVNEITVKILDFNQSSASMDGTWYMNSVFSLLGVHSQTMISLDDTERVKVGMKTIMEARHAMIELWENPNYRGMHSYVRFYPDYVEASYSTHFGPVRLERQ